MNITRKTLKRRRSNAKGKRSSLFIVVLRRESSRSKYSRNDRLEWDNLMVSNSTRTDDALVFVDFTLAELSPGDARHPHGHNYSRHYTQAQDEILPPPPTRFPTCSPPHAL